MQNYVKRQLEILRTILLFYSVRFDVDNISCSTCELQQRTFSLIKLESLNYIISISVFF